MTAILSFFLVLGVLVCIHELGHFVAARLSGVRVDEFGFGFPPKIVGKKIGNTEYTLNWLPLGGFVRIKGIAGETEAEDLMAEDSFQSKTFLQKSFILLAGVAMNFLLAIVLFTIVFTIGTRIPLSAASENAILSDSALVVTHVMEDSVASTSGLLPGDTIIGAGNIEYPAYTALTDLLQSSEGSKIAITVKRDEEIVELTVIPESVVVDERTYVGIGIGAQETAFARYSFIDAVSHSISQTWNLTVLILVSLGQMLVDLFTGAGVSEDLAGPVGIAKMTGEVARQGIINLLYFAAILSINLGIFNLLPIPALDGGRWVFVIWEHLTGKPLSENIQAKIHQTGFALLILLIVVVTVQDIIRL